MSKSLQRLAQLIELAENKTENAAKVLAVRQGELTQMETQVNTLREHQMQLMQQNQTGQVFNIQDLERQRLFIGQMKLAMDGLLRQKDQYAYQVEQARLAYLNAKREEKALQTLKERKLQEEQTQAEKRLQKETDEWVSQRFARKDLG